MTAGCAATYDLVREETSHGQGSEEEIRKDDREEGQEGRRQTVREEKSRRQEGHKKTAKKKVAKKVAATVLVSGARGNPGADSLSVVKQSLVDGAEAFYGAMPRFWGRYFKGPGNTSLQQYHATEGLVLRSNGIRLLAIGRQTTNVGGTEAIGASDGENNANAIHGEVSSLSGDVLVFLDVEQSHPLSRAYYRGWVAGIQEVGASNSVNFIPCVYGSFAANPTWQALAAEFANGVPCGGVWIARYQVSNGCAAMPAVVGFADATGGVARRGAGARAGSMRRTATASISTSAIRTRRRLSSPA